MRIRHLRTFAMAAEMESFSHAAEALAVTQPAVSQQVGKLEYELGVSLFERRGRRIRLTENGRLLYRYVREVLDLLDCAKSAIGARTETVSGTLRIASCTLPPETFLPALLSRFRQLYPEIREAVTVSDTTEATRAVESGAADLAFVVVLPGETRLSTRAVVRHELVLLVAPQHPLARREWISLDEVLQESFVLREAGSGTRQIAEQVLREAGIPIADLHVAMETNSNETVRGAVRQGHVIGFMPREAVQSDLGNGQLVKLNVKDVRAWIDTHLVTDPERVPTMAARAFLEYLDSSELLPSATAPRS